MSVNILIQDLYLDFSYSKDMSLERRFFVEIELNKNNQEIIVFMNELNSVFIQNKKLHNIVLLDNKDLAYEFSIKEQSKPNVQEHKELLILEKEKVFSLLKKLVINNLESRTEETWLDFCQKRYHERKIDFTAEHKKLELEKFYNSNQEIKTIWKNFPNTMKQYSLGGELSKSETIHNKFSNFWSEIYFLHLDSKFEKKSLKEKKPKI